MNDPDPALTDLVLKEQGRLHRFIGRWVADAADAEDVFQEVFFELVEAQRLTTPLRQAGAWMVRVARNRITDLFRRRHRMLERWEQMTPEQREQFRQGARHHCQHG